MIQRRARRSAGETQRHLSEESLSKQKYSIAALARADADVSSASLACMA
jgi:hypothetical protein